MLYRVADTVFLSHVLHLVPRINCDMTFTTPADIDATLGMISSLRVFQTTVPQGAHTTGQGKAVGKARKASYVVYAEAKRMIEASSTRERAQETSLRRAARDTGLERERGKLGRAKNLKDRVYVLTLGFR